MILRIGSRGAAVEALQLALQRAGYYSGAIDGIFGVQTRNAVLSFQRDRGLAADGVVGTVTMTALEPYLRGYITYTVTQGDTLYKIARRYNTAVNAILTANPGIDPMTLGIGTRLTVPMGFDVIPTNIRWTSEIIRYTVEGIIARYPFITSSSIGRSVMGRPLYTLKIGTGPVRVYYSASIHANEWITTPVLMRFIEQYAKAYVNGGSIFSVPARELYSGVTLYITPMLNPDGVDLVAGYLNSGRYYTQARTIAQRYLNVRFPEGWKANINGVDLNLQFPAGWENAREIKYAQGYTTPAPRDFVGYAPLTEPEAQAIFDFTQNLSPALILAYHTQGEIIYWKFSDYEPPRSREIGELMSRASGYLLELTPESSGYAGYKDWFIQDLNRPGYTIECGVGTSPLPLSQFEEIYRDNLGILVLGMTEAEY